MGIFVRPWLCGALAAVGLVSANGPAAAGKEARTLIVDRVDDGVLSTVPGNVRPEATPQNDRGAIDDSTPLEHMSLLLQRPPEREAALEQMIDALHDPGSPEYHHWLSPARIGTDYGPAPADRAKIVHWLTSRGFRVNFIRPNGMIVDFSGTAGQVRAAFHTELHHLEVAGKAHVANTSEQRIPAALAPAVAGIVTLNDFAPRPQSEFSPDFAHPCTNRPGHCDAVAPADIATIYNFNPLFHAGITGIGQRIAVINLSNPANLADWSTFRRRYGLSGYAKGSLTLVHPQPARGSSNCIDPGVNTAEDEAILDAEWSSAAAPNAHILLASCLNSSTTSGLLAAVMNLEEETATVRPQIINISYGECEAFHGALVNKAYNSAFQTAVAEGISIFVSSGDALSTTCDRDEPAASLGLAVSSPASTPYNVAVGGTDFSDTYHNDVGTYWNNTNSSARGSAKSYIPEIAWNGSCASELVVKYYHFGSSYGPQGFCNAGSAAELAYFKRVIGAGGGTSRCATGSPAPQDAGGGTCRGNPLPTWQKGVFGVPTNGLRNLPDVSLFSANRPWGHSYVICATDQNGCIYGWGGTSFATPIMAGVQALVNQKMKAARGEGNPNVVFYKLAANAYSSSTGRSACNSSNGNRTGKTCIFHDVTEGDIEAPCRAGSPDCFSPASQTGASSLSSTAFRPGFRAEAGWDFATGLGSVNVTNLVAAWHTVAP